MEIFLPLSPPPPTTNAKDKTSLKDVFWPEGKTKVVANEQSTSGLSARVEGEQDKTDVVNISLLIHLCHVVTLGLWKKNLFF